MSSCMYPIARLTLSIPLLACSSFMVFHAGASIAQDAPAPQIVPTVVATVDTSAAGGWARPLIGDVNGDGRLDIVMMQPHYVADDRFEGALVAALTAYDIEDGLLWQAGTVDPQGRNNSSDIPAQIHDIDGDGRNEVVAIMHPQGDRSLPGRFMIFDGLTGELIRDFALPDRLAHDAIIFANFTGKKTAQDILLKDRYGFAWAIDNHGNVLWTHAGNTGHYPWPYDVDDDGRQEIMIGYDFMSPDGQLLWQHQGGGHADTMWVADVNGDASPELVLGGDAAVAHDMTTGAELWRNADIVETQNIITADFLPELPGLESLGLDRIDRSAAGYDGLFLLDSAGAFVFREQRETRGCWGSIPEVIHNWTGDYGDLIMAWNRGCGEPTTIKNGRGELITTLENVRLWHADFCGDDKEEVVEYLQGSWLQIKSNGACDLTAKQTGRPLPQSKRLYNLTRYTAGEAPRDLAANDSVVTSSGWLTGHKANDGDVDTAWLASLPGPGQSWRVNLGRWYTLAGIELTFPDVQLPPWCELIPLCRQHERYQFGYIVEVSKDGRHWVKMVDRRRNERETRTQKALFTALAQHVRITFTRVPTLPFARAGLAEVKVLGYR
jgi:hypothetical protein